MSRYRTIRVVEDDANDAEMTVRALQADHLLNEIVVARDGVEVLQYLRREGRWDGRSGGLPGLLLLDIKMPRMDGLQVLREIRADPVLKVLPVVMLAPSQQSPDLRTANELGANACVVEPVGFEDFSAAVQRIGDFWAMVDHPPMTTGGRRWKTSHSSRRGEARRGRPFRPPAPRLTQPFRPSGRQARRPAAAARTARARRSRGRRRSWPAASS